MGNEIISMPIGTDRVRFTALSAFGNNAFIDDITAGGPTGTGTPLTLVPDKFEFHKIILILSTLLQRLISHYQSKAL
jgi:hypothetical protein